MRPFRASRIVPLALVVMSCCAGASAQHDYEIKLTRPAKVGERHRLKATATQSGRTVMHIGSERTPPKSDQAKMEMEAISTVLAVNEGGQPSQISYEVIKCMANDNGDAVEVVAPGKVIIASRGNGPDNITFKDGAMSDEVRARLDVVLSALSDSDDNDAAFGTTERKQVGDTWTVNTEAVAKQIAEHSEGVKPSAIKGKSRLESVSNVQGVPCMEVVSSVTIRGIMPGGDELPAEFKVQNSIVRIEMTGLYPVDVNESIRGGTIIMDVEADLAGSSARSGSPISLKVARAMKRQLDFTLTPMDAAP